MLILNSFDVMLVDGCPRNQMGEYETRAVELQQKLPK